MECPRCRARMPEVAHFCHCCGQDMRSPDVARRKSFAVKPDEPVASFALVSTIMPRGAGERPQTYRLALMIALTAALVAAVFGALPVAVLLAAFAIPIVYIVYIYDVNLWEDEPIPVTAMAFVLTGVLAAGLLVGLKTFGLLDLPVPAADIGGTRLGGPTVGGFLVAALLIPVVGELIRQVGPVFLASRPQFDDLMDGLTFGIISGVAYSTADTLVRHWSSLTGGFVPTTDSGTWATLVFLEGFVKPLVIGTATGIACAEFSGLGAGYDGFTGRYLRGLAEAVVANVAYAGGVHLLGFVPETNLRVIVQVMWALLILGVLVIRVRNVLHHGLMEAALEASARQGVGETDGVGATGELDFCPRCEMPLLAHSVFCTACGTAVRTRSKLHRGGQRRTREVDGSDPEQTTSRPTSVIDESPTAEQPAIRPEPSAAENAYQDEEENR